MRLLNLQGTGYAHLQADGTVTAVAGREATDLVIYKADAPDPNRPTTCDRHVRDGDYVFVRAPNQDEWAALDLSGALYLPPASSKPCPTSDSDAESQRCPQDDEVCSSDQRGLSSVRGRRTATIRRRKALHRRFLRRQDWPHAVSAGTVRVTVPA